MEKNRIRQVLPFNQGWSFTRGEEEKETVCLPHPVSLTPAISSGGRNYQGVCRYDKRLVLPDGMEQKKAFLKLEGAMDESRLFVNGRPAAVHTCGYTPLCADITEFLNPGRENELSVLLDNSDCEDLPPGKAQSELDYTYEGGLYRDAWLILTERLYITDPLIENETAGGGVFIWYTRVSEESAYVHARIHAANETECRRCFTVHVRLLGPSGELAAETAVDSECAEDGRSYTEVSLKVERPALWSPESPSLYLMKIWLTEEGTLWDDMEITTGIRDFRFTRDKGVVFNGRPRIISGANYHQSWPYIGNAVPDSLLIRDIIKLKELGMENIRGHYPFGEAFTDACDSLGMTLIVSLPGWQWFKEGLFVERCYENLRHIIRWQRNHPCVLIWEVLPNETQTPLWFQEDLVRIAREEYPYEPFYTASDYGPTDIAYREYDPGMLAPGMEAYGAEQKWQERPLWVREYGDAPDNWTDQNCAWRIPRGFGDTAMLKAVERMLGMDPQFPSGGYLTMYNRKDICGYGVWPGIEHNRGYHINPCYGGYYDLFRLPKFTAEFIRCQQDPARAGYLVFIANWWMEISPGDVTVFSNADRVRLLYDGVLVEEREPEKLPVMHPPFIFHNVRSRFKGRERGMLTAEALTADGVAAAACVKSPGVPKALRLSVDSCGIPLKADGSDIVAVRCSLADRDNNTVPLMGDRHPVLFEIEGEGMIVGDERIGANPVYPEAGIATVLIRSTCRAGVIRLRASMYWPQRGPAAIEPDEIEIVTV